MSHTWTHTLWLQKFSFPSTMSILLHWCLSRSSVSSNVANLQHLSSLLLSAQHPTPTPSLMMSSCVCISHEYTPLYNQPYILSESGPVQNRRPVYTNLGRTTHTLWQTGRHFRCLHYLITARLDILGTSQPAKNRNLSLRMSNLSLP